MNYPQPQLFPRQAQRERAGLQADPVVMARYERMVLMYGGIVPQFVGADVTEYYESHYGPLDKPDENKNARGLGSLYGSMQRRGLIRKTGGANPRKNGNASFVYELVKG